MEILAGIAVTVFEQLQRPTLAFLITGMMLAALGSRFEVPDPVYKFIVVLLLLKVGMGAGIAIRDADFLSLLVPALGAAAVGITIVLLGGLTLARRRGISQTDGLATAGLFGAVSASTLAAGMAILDDEGITYEGFVGALYPFMDIAALVTAIVLAKVSTVRATKTAGYVNADGTLSAGGPPRTAVPSGDAIGAELVRAILVDTLRSPAISALLAGLGLGLLSQPDGVFASFYEPVFPGLLSVLMLIMGMEAWARIAELRKVAHTYLVYGLIAPLVHGMIGFAVGLLAHHLTGFSAGGVVLLAVMAASSSDISGPPTIRAALPEANASAYVGTSTGLGTPVALLSIPLFLALAELLI